MNSIECTICERKCAIAEGGSGACGRYQAHDGNIVELFPDRYIVACPISIETMPILHYHPGSKFLQISTTGCNFDCPGCISTVIVKEMSPNSGALQQLTPEEVVRKAIDNDCTGIVALMNDPLANLHSFIKIATLAREKGLHVGCSSNSYFTEASLATLIPRIDFINIGMKGFSDQAYRACGVNSIEPVLRNLNVLSDSGIHVEISCIFNRSNKDELRDLACHISSISRKIPLQIMRFIPFGVADISQEPSIREAESLCGELKEMLDYVYLFNSPGTELLNTLCPECGETVVKRDFYGPMGAKFIAPDTSETYSGQCSRCSRTLDLVGEPTVNAYQEGDFEGGYPFTRALEIVEAMLIAMGVNQKQLIVRAWENLLSSGSLQTFHKSIQNPRTYLELIKCFGGVAGVNGKSDVLVAYMEQRLTLIESALVTVPHRPRVYYAMGKPLFYIRGGRLENQLVEFAGGISVNRKLPLGGRPGQTIAVDQLNELDPEVIFISAFISNSVDDFIDECLRLGVTVKAVQNRRVYAHPAPGWDFGGPQWILGLMFIANRLHPDSCKFDVMAEADAYYRKFYDMEFSLPEVNRSFGKPSAAWQWSKEASI